MKHNKGIAETAIILIVGFMSVCIYRMFTTKPHTSCVEYQEILNRGEYPSGMDIKDHFYHGHWKK